MGAAIQLNSISYEYVIWALQNPCTETWDENMGSQVFAVFDHLASNPPLIKTLCILHSKGITHYRKLLSEKLLEAKEEKSQTHFELILDKGMNFIRRMIAYGEYKSAKILL